MYFDPLYFLFMVPGLLLSLWATWRVRSTFARYSRVRTANGITGADAAARLLAGAGVHDVRIVETAGHLSDHYNPGTKTLALSHEVYASPSVAAVGVACHEAGHAIQHAKRYAPMSVRSILVPTANIGSSLGYMAMWGDCFSRARDWLRSGPSSSRPSCCSRSSRCPWSSTHPRAKSLAFEQGIVLDGERAGVNAVLNRRHDLPRRGGVDPPHAALLPRPRGPAGRTPRGLSER